MPFMNDRERPRRAIPTPRTCARCRRVLPLGAFPLRRKDGTKRYGHCRDCKAIYQRQWYVRNAERHRAVTAANRAAVRQFLAQGTVLQNQATLHGGMAYHRQQAFGLIGFGQKIKSAIVHGLHGHINITVAGNQHDRLLGITSMQGLHQRQTIHARHANVEQHEEGLVGTTRATVEMLKKHGFMPVLMETSGGHTWTNWRLYLSEFAPLLFQGPA